MGVPGPKLMDEEKATQDFFGVSPPTFVTPDVRANAQLQRASLQNAPTFYFLNLHESHVLDFIMQGLWIKTQSSPFEAPYFSCVPYLLGEGQAMQYSFWPKWGKRTPIPRLPLRPPDDYLRQAMVEALNTHDVEIDFRVQLQTDPFLMPIENAAVRERLADWYVRQQGLRYTRFSGISRQKTLGVLDEELQCLARFGKRAQHRRANAAGPVTEFVQQGFEGGRQVDHQ
jgi:hypothetical protein